MIARMYFIEGGTPVSMWWGGGGATRAANVIYMYSERDKSANYRGSSREKFNKFLVKLKKNHTNILYIND